MFLPLKAIKRTHEQPNDHFEARLYYILPGFSSTWQTGALRCSPYVSVCAAFPQTALTKNFRFLSFISKARTLFLQRHAGAEARNRQRAAAVAALGAIYYAEGRAENADDMKPVYLRKSQAEREREEESSRRSRDSE